MKKIDALKLSELVLKFSLNLSTDETYMYDQINEYIKETYKDDVSECSNCGQKVADEWTRCVWCNSLFSKPKITKDELATLQTERLNPFWLRNRKNMILEEMKSVLGFAGTVRVKHGKKGWAFQLENKTYINLRKTGSVQFMGKFEVPSDFEERVNELKISETNPYGISVTVKMSDRKLRELVKAYFERWDR